jgi:hypothetical protein
MAGILYDARRIKAYERLVELGEASGETRQWCERLWEDIVFYGDLVDELMYFLDNHSLKDSVKCEGYGLTDLYMWQLTKFNIMGDSGKNTELCNKDKMVLWAFRDMADMRKNPEPFIRNMTLGKGMDKEN